MENLHRTVDDRSRTAYKREALVFVVPPLGGTSRIPPKGGTTNLHNATRARDSRNHLALRTHNPLPMRQDPA